MDNDVFVPIKKSIDTWCNKYKEEITRLNNKINNMQKLGKWIYDKIMIVNQRWNCPCCGAEDDCDEDCRFGDWVQSLEKNKMT